MGGMWSWGKEYMAPSVKLHVTPSHELKPVPPSAPTPQHQLLTHPHQSPPFTSRFIQACLPPQPCAHVAKLTTLKGHSIADSAAWEHTTRTTVRRYENAEYYRDSTSCTLQMTEQLRRPF